ncbi:putative membrane protein [Sorangium cellulosum So ce56]|uniref:Membrane protein n=1 Tax=Sorangium cellulosum (strain So ce56) TaxID=448385 RepID=A9FUD7_SORC5|nr:ATP-binding protein [Sorangium cellulosum]CAN98622.1 putative membrane protein [Sorangium cellulosum So ce56]
MANDKGKARFGDGKWSAPFGRYENPDAAEWPANEFLVARVEQRRRFLNLLLTHGRRGAYLITGQRGSGKTSFVNYCLNEYRQDVFGRFLNGKVGRSIYDRAGLVTVICIFGVIAFTGKGLLHFIIHEWHPRPNENLRFVLAAPLLLAFLYPIIVARGLLEVATDFGLEKVRSGKPTEERRFRDWLYERRGFLAVVVVMLLVVRGALILYSGGSWSDRLREAISTPATVVAFLIASTSILGHACALRLTEVDQNRRHNKIARFLRILMIIGLLPALLNWAASLGLEHLPVLSSVTQWKPNVESPLLKRLSNSLAHILEAPSIQAVKTPLIIAALGWMGDLIAGFFGRSSRLDDWAGKPGGDSNDAGRNRPPRFVRQRVILVTKAVCLVVFSAIFILDAVVSRFSTTGVEIKDEITLLATLVILSISIARLEYNWIIRPHLRAKSGVVIDMARKDHQDVTVENYMRRLDNHTSFAFLYRWWIPSLVVRVNLGVEALDHRRVIDAMLTGLRDAYERTFLNWRSPLANAGWIVRLMLLVTATTLVADHFFVSSVNNAYMCNEMCALRPKINRILCPAGGIGESIARGLQFELISPRGDDSLWDEPCYVDPEAPWPRGASRQTIAQLVLPTSIRDFGQNGNHDYRHSIDLRLYHLLIFLVLLVAARIIERRWPIFAYRQTLRNIDDTIASLSSTLKQEHGIQLRLGKEILTIGDNRKQETAPLDPRTVELMFLRLLHQIDEAALRLPFVAGAHVSVPVPDVFFVFDELDKLGTRKGPASPAPGSDEGPAVSNSPGRERAVLLKNLLSDLKNVLSSAPARFIFVGGRNLHDEWLADQTSRQPLLTRLFVAEIYLPSLLTDRYDMDRLESGVEEFIRAQLNRANIIYGAWMRSRTLRWMRHAPREYLAPSFVPHENLPEFRLPFHSITDSASSSAAHQGKTASDPNDPNAQSVLRPSDVAEQLSILARSCRIPQDGRDDGWRKVLYGRLVSLANVILLAKDNSSVTSRMDTLDRDLIAFLTYRSMGNVKRLKEILDGTIEQVASGAVLPSMNNKGQPAAGGIDPHTHAIILRDADVHRIQLIADIYRGLVRMFGAGTWQDDKLAPAVFYMADFLLKFHRRAFTWSNLERIDELVHVHRAPELRKMLYTIVGAWTGNMLHPIRNGMFDFRFRIDTALELRLASRRSDEEMVALNFTLDEAQEIKEMYRRRLAMTTDPATFEFEAALGEHHDLDEEYDLARYHYRRAIRLLDDQVANDLIGTRPGQTMDAKDGSILHQLITRDPKTIETIRRHPHWAVGRIRLMLQIALTYERIRDFESAALGYRSARSLAEVLLESVPLSEVKLTSKEDSYELLKHANLLFQPAFAEAWVGEKEGTLVDASVALVERAIADSRKRLPFVNKPFERRRVATSPTSVHHALFALTLAELHDKAGDLLFFKGKPSSTHREDEGGAHRGYLDRSHFHYASSLHELRSYNRYRRCSSGPKLGFDQRTTTLPEGAAPDFVLQIAAGSLADLAEAMLAGMSLRATLNSGGPDGARVKKNIVLGVSIGKGPRTGAVPQMVECMIDWIGAVGGAERKFASEWIKIFGHSDGGDLSIWLGSVAMRRADFMGTRANVIPRSPSFEHGERGGRAQFAASLVCSMASARILKRDGRLEDAARESLQVAETVARWLLARHFWLSLDGRHMEEHLDEAWKNLLGLIAAYSVQKAQLWWRLSRRSLHPGGPGHENAGEATCRDVGSEKKNGIQVVTPRAVERIVTLLNHLYSGPGGASQELRDMLKDLIGPCGLRKDNLISQLEESLKYNMYPMTHQIYGRKILVDVRAIELFRRLEGPSEADVRALSDGLNSLWNDVETLMQADGEYDGRHRFTHSDIGLTLGFACFVANRVYGKHPGMSSAFAPDKVEQVRSNAITHLDRAEESFTLRRSYQLWIEDLYYLYDDFNDRRLHYNRAAEMAVSELIAAMLKKLREQARSCSSAGRSPPVQGEAG